MTPYVELQVTSNYTFLEGASHPDELVLMAAALGHKAMALTDRNSLAGVVRAHAAAKQAGIRLVVGTRLDLLDAPSLLCFPTDRAAYGRLSRLLTLGKRRAPKGECHLHLADVVSHGDGQIFVAIAPERPEETFSTALEQLKIHFNKCLYLSVNTLYNGTDKHRMAILDRIAKTCRVPLVATNDVHAHAATRRPLQDVLTCIREHCTIHQAGFRLFANAERHLKPGDEMARLFKDYPDAVARTVEIAESCPFSLDELRYEYPVDPVPDGMTPQEELVRLTWVGAAGRYPEGLPTKVRDQISHEIALIGDLGFSPYFLTVHDIVRFARERGILCQGRGSAANSAVCYCLGITAVDPARIDVLFERFISAERGEPPDIDVDFENERREEVIQYVYEKYGRERAGMTATVITYRTKSALREVGKVMGLSEDSVVALQKAAWRLSWDEIEDRRIRESGLDPEDRTVRMVMDLAGELRGFPRHLSQHTGGMVITQGLLCEVMPISNAAMEDRTVIEWDKNDLDALGILKIDILGLGMLTCIRKAFELIEEHHGRPLSLATVPAGDAPTYDMLCQGDSVGVFQVESRAQMAMLPRLKPRCFYDLVIEVAIVRPGPIQGDMVHPYLRRRSGRETVEFPSDELRQVLGKTLGVPLFQEQAMRIAIAGAGFTPAESDALRRAMATFRHYGEIHGFREKFIGGMLARGYERDFAERCFKQIEGFADYGFPESHAASFALLVYVSAWLKCHYPAAFACALLNSQPMGFYAPAQIVRDARDHGVEIRPVDVSHSQQDNTLEQASQGTGCFSPLREKMPVPETPVAARGDQRQKSVLRAPTASPGVKRGQAPFREEKNEKEPVPVLPALRLGLHQIKGLSERDAVLVVETRTDIPALWRAGVSRAGLEALARADAFNATGLDRRQALWAVRGLDDAAPLPLFMAAGTNEPPVALPAMTRGEQVADDYRALRLSLKAHPLALLRPALQDTYAPCSRLTSQRHGQRTRIAGLVITRQRPGSAKGVVFITLEDETGIANLIIHAATFERCRKTVLGATLLGIHGRIQREGQVIHVVAESLSDHTALLNSLTDAATTGEPLGIRSRDFH
jgi:error-prone DNA polymerase